jgi:hypothetical protein
MMGKRGVFGANTADPTPFLESGVLLVKSKQGGTLICHITIFLYKLRTEGCQSPAKKIRRFGESTGCDFS